MTKGRFALRRILTLVFLAGLLGSATLFGQSETDNLKAAHRLLWQAVESANVDLLVQRVHPNAFGFFRGSQIPIEFSMEKGVRDLAPSLMADLSPFVTLPHELKYHVIGNTGVICATLTRTPAPGADKDKKKQGPQYTRATYVYTRSGDSWLLFSWHTSEIPLVRK
jgi:hypothetical protein